MDAMVSFLKFILVLGVIILVGVGLFGYGCKSCGKVSASDFKDVPCAPVLSDGSRNLHYHNVWNNCQARCGIKMPYVDLKTCKCECN